jgi:hypothetical protein
MELQALHSIALLNYNLDLVAQFQILSPLNFEKMVHNHAY